MVLLSGYSITETLYESAGTAIYRAVRGSDGAPVVCKLLSMEYPSARDLSSFRREYAIDARLQGQGTVKVFGLEQVGNSLAILMEDFGGEALSRNGSLKEAGLQERLHVAAQIAEALAAIHRLNVIHKDINPSNIVRNPETGVVKIIDFGIATELRREAASFLDVVALEGTLPYISPEQTGRMNRPIDYRTDLYSLGVTFYELFTGRLPFESDDTLELVYAHIAKLPRSPREVRSDLPEALAAIILKLLAKTPEDRYQSALGVLHDLDHCIHELTPSGEIADFPIGKHDGTDKFTIPNRLYGREREIRVLHEALAETAGRAGSLLWVAGPPGIGKTTLIQEIHKSLSGQKGFLIAGKCNPIERNVPYGGFVQAFRDLLDQLLGAPAALLGSCKTAILSTLGTNIGVLVELVPKLRQVVGPQPAPASLDPVAAHHRLQRVIRGFIEAFIRNDHPIVIFLDDLQWADAPTLDLIKYLFAGEGVPGLLLIGAYRDSEVRDGHPLAALLKALDDNRTNTAVGCRTISVGPLDLEAVNTLVADTLRRRPEETRELSTILHGKTDGNPFFTNQMLTSLHGQGAFSYDATEDAWKWDLGQVAKAELSANVVELLVQELGSLSAQTKAILKIAACLGNKFELRTLSAVCDQQAGDLRAGLWEAIAKEVVIPLSRNYRMLTVAQGHADLSDVDLVFRFQHDRLLQAVQSTLSDEESTHLHYRIGRELLKAFRHTEAASLLFSLVNHLNLGRAHIAGKDERIELAELNAMAGRKAFASTAFRGAAEYFETARSLLSGDDWESMPTKRFALCLQHAESAFLGGDLQKADELVGPLLDLASGNIERAAVHNLRSRIREFQCDLGGAIDEIRKGLGPLGIALPATKEQIERSVGEGLGKLQAGFARTSIDQLVNLGEMNDAEKATAMRLLAQVVPAAIQSSYPLYMVATMTMAELTLTHGITTESCKCIADCGIIFTSVLGDYETGYRLGKAAFALIDRLEAGWQKPPVCFAFTFVSHMRKHYREGLDHYDMSYRLGLEVGDMQHATYARAHRVHLMAWVGVNLAECRRETESTIAFLKESQGFVQLMLANIVLHAIRKLQTTPQPEEEQAWAKTDTEILATLEQLKHVVLIGRFSQYNAFLHYVLGDVELAERWSETAERLLFAAGADFPVADHHLVHALLCLDRLKRDAAADRESSLARVADALGRLKKMADNCPENYAHKYYWLAAELAVTRGEPLETAVGLYDKALASIGKGDFPHMVALIHESQGKLWIQRKNDTVAKAFLREAHFHYEQWGSQRKIDAMERQYRDYFALREDAGVPSGGTSYKTHKTQKTHGSSKAISNAALDITSIIKSTQAISSEIRTEKLLRTLLQTILENAGAQSGCFLLARGSAAELGIVALRRAGCDAVEIIESLPYWNSPNLCREIVEYVERTHESVVLDDAASGDRFGGNDYIRRHAVKSVLCMPVIHQNALKGVVYLENNLADHVFTTERLNILAILASQASISIENAQLYEDMEGKVRERTNLLRQANDRLKELALVDPLTRLNNRRYFHDHITGVTDMYIRRLNRCLNGSEQRKLSLAESVMGVFLVDIDHFKEVNDTWGHAAGDAVLVAISTVLRALVRADDFIVRWGGEEFLVILNNTSPGYLDRFARKVLSSVQETAIPLAEDIVIHRTCSIGYTQIPFSRVVPDFLTLEQTITLSDHAMYVAKQNGRNRAVCISLKEGKVPGQEVRDYLLGIGKGPSEGPWERLSLLRSVAVTGGAIEIKQVLVTD